MMKASRPKPKRAPAAKKAAAQKKKHKIFKPRRTRRKLAAKRASKRKPNAQAARNSRFRQEPNWSYVNLLRTGGGRGTGN
jgi:hypothetical protein